MDDFQVCLNRAFQRAKEAVPNYSLRDFARYLDVDASTLSKMLKGKRAPSQLRLSEFLQKLQEDAEQPAYTGPE